MLKALLQRALLVSGGIALALIVGEAAVYVGYWAVRGHPFPREEYRSAMAERLTGSETRPAASGVLYYPKDVMHPYLGFVPNPAVMPDKQTIGDPAQVLAHSDRELIVGVFGGSFAAGLCAFAGGELRRVLARPGKDVRLLCLAAGGYKQPQQFLALAYLLAQGAHFDLVINVDGFNEVALSPSENVMQGVAPLYPRGWRWRVGDLTDPGALELLGALYAVDRDRRDWADAFVRWGLHRSALLTFAWENRDRLFDVERGRILAALNDHKIEQRKSYAATGPTMTFANDRSLYDYLVRVWKDSSLQMKLLCDGNGIAYEHFLQPNQHVPGSKPMRPEELRLAGPGLYHDEVIQGYPLLQQQGQELRRAGVRFHDLTAVFKDVQDPVYSDGCCHLTGPGYRMIARVIGDVIGGERAAPQADQSAAQTVPP